MYTNIARIERNFSSCNFNLIDFAPDVSTARDEHQAETNTWRGI